ncbi:MAG: GTP-binding protein [Planctomycetota bacterium]
MHTEIIDIDVSISYHNQLIYPQMSKQNFIDHVKIHCKSGNGGKGSSHFRREKYISKGGPDGGDGGRGGHVILKGNKNLWTLLHLKYRKHVKADHGMGGSKSRSTGADGEDTIIEVPLGTIVRDDESGKQLVEILDQGQEYVVKSGGKGGLGNTHFKNSVRQAPTYSQPGLPGVEGWVVLELKVLADVGLVGFPNVGKSTLLSAITAAEPKIGDYEFTTLKPNLGIVAYRDHQSFIMADIPGIIEGASKGKGLGLRFLRHIERNSCLLFMVPADSKDIAKDYEILKDELKKFNPELLVKERILAITKSDLMDTELREMVEKDLKKNLTDEIDYTFISSVARLNLDVLKDKIWKTINDSIVD